MYQHAGIEQEYKRTPEQADVLVIRVATVMLRCMIERTYMLLMQREWQASQRSELSRAERLASSRPALFVASLFMISV